MMFSTTSIGQKAPKVLDDVRKELEEEFTQSLRGYAESAGWPKDVASYVHIKHGDDGFEVEIREPHTKTVNDLEYGTQTNAPTGVLRSFMSKLGTRETGSRFLNAIGRLM